MVEEAPSIEKGTLTVNPDGTMVTRYRLRPDVKWHDGTPLTTQDWLFGWELTRDPAALKALRRATTFHENFTWPDGTPVETVNDRNRHWGVSAWSQFAFSNFPDGRRYAEFLASFFRPEKMTMESLGRLAQDALYFHEGAKEPIPQDQP